MRLIVQLRLMLRSIVFSLAIYPVLSSASVRSVPWQNFIQFNFSPSVDSAVGSSSNPQDLFSPSFYEHASWPATRSKSVFKDLDSAKQSGLGFSWISTPLSLGASFNLQGKDWSCGVHVGQKKSLFEHAVFDPLSDWQTAVDPLLAPPSSKGAAFAGCHITQHITSDWDIEYAVNLRKRPCTTLSNESFDAGKDPVVAGDAVDAPMAPPLKSSLAAQAASIVPGAPSRPFFAEAIITVVYSFCSSHLSWR